MLYSDALKKGKQGIGHKDDTEEDKEKIYPDLTDYETECVIKIDASVAFQVSSEMNDTHNVTRVNPRTAIEDQSDKTKDLEVADDNNTSIDAEIYAIFKDIFQEFDSCEVNIDKDTVEPSMENPDEVKPIGDYKKDTEVGVEATTKSPCEIPLPEDGDLSSDDLTSLDDIEVNSEDNIEENRLKREEMILEKLGLVMNGGDSLDKVIDKEPGAEENGCVLNLAEGCFEANRPNSEEELHENGHISGEDMDDVDATVELEQGGLVDSEEAADYVGQDTHRAESPASIEMESCSADSLASVDEADCNTVEVDGRRQTSAVCDDEKEYTAFVEELSVKLVKKLSIIRAFVEALSMRTDIKEELTTDIVDCDQEIIGDQENQHLSENQEDIESRKSQTLNGEGDQQAQENPSLLQSNESDNKNETNNLNDSGEPQLPCAKESHLSKGLNAGSEAEDAVRVAEDLMNLVDETTAMSPTPPTPSWCLCQSTKS
jgi:hypothetical protein